MIANQRHLFDLPREVAYLNCAYMSPLLNRVVEIGRAATGVKAQPWRLSPPDFFAGPDRARGLFGRLIGATADDVAVVPSASYGIAVAAANLSPAPGSRILLFREQFPSNVYAWRELAQRSGAEIVTVAPAQDGDLTRALLAAIDERTSIVAAAHCRWTDGGLVDLAAVGERVRAVGGALVLDLTQSAGAMPFDVAAVRPDFAVAATYKWLMGPYSLGFLYVAPQRQDGRPIEYNWMNRAGSENFAGLVDYQDGFQPGARRYDVGEVANFVAVPMATAALEQLLAWGVDQIAATLQAKTDAIAARAARLGLKATDGSLRAGHFLGLGFPDGLPPGLPERLAKEQVYVSVRGTSLRVTPHLYNDEADVDRLFAALEAVV